MAGSHRVFKSGLTKWLSAEAVIRAEPLRGLQGLFLAQDRDTREYVFRRYAPVPTRVFKSRWEVPGAVVAWHSLAELGWSRVPFAPGS